MKAPDRPFEESPTSAAAAGDRDERDDRHDRDDRDRREAERYRALAYIDPLVGLANRAGLLLRLEALSAAAAGDTALALLHIDGLDRYNAEYGYAEGDRLISALARSIDDEASRGGADHFCARLHGACFAVVVTVDGEAAARACGDRLRARLKEAIGLMGVAGLLDFAIGVCSCPAGASAAELLGAADTALAAARHLGRGALVVDWLTTLPEDASLAWRRRLERALAGERFFLAGQDVYALAANGAERPSRLLHTEVLARLQLEDGGELTAGQFVPMAARHGLLGAIDGHCLSLLCAGIASGTAPAERFAINLSADVLRQREFTHDLLDRLERLGERAASLVFEVSVFAAQVAAVELAALMAEARRFGVALSIDQYGLDTQGFEVLRRFVPRTVKLAGSLLADLRQGDEKLFYLESVCRVAAALDVTLIATCVESVDLLPTLSRIGVQGVQGCALASVRPLFRAASRPAA